MQDNNIIDRLSKFATFNPNRNAISYNQRVITYSEFGGWPELFIKSATYFCRH